MTSISLAAIEKKMQGIAKATYPFVRKEVTRVKTREMLKDQKYKLERLADIPEDGAITMYTCGNFASKERFGVSNNEIRKSLSVQVLQEVVPNEALRAKAVAAVMVLPNVTHQIGKDKPLSQQNNPKTPYFNAVQKALGNTPE